MTKQSKTSQARTFDDIHVPRADLARAYLELLKAQPGRPLAMFAPRRVGKTYFLDHDLTPLAAREGWLPIYADLWLQRSDPLAAMNHALEEALDDIVVPRGRASRAVNTPVRHVGALGASVTFGEKPARRALPTAPELRMDALVARLAAAAGRPLLLMLDEVQALADVADGERIVAALRAVLHKRRDVVRAVFTGSSQEALARMVSVVGAPMYQFAQLMHFPPLGDEFLEALATHFAGVHKGKRLAMDNLQRAFEQIGFKPGLMRDLVKAMSAEGITDVNLGIQRLMMDERQVAGWMGILQGQEILERAVLMMLAQGRPAFGQETLDRLGQLLGERPTLAKVRSAVERLRRAGIVAKGGRGAVIEDALFADYLRDKPLDRLS
jgi:hypothetical protein